MPGNYRLDCLNENVKTLNNETSPVEIKFESFSSYVPIKVNEKSHKYLEKIPCNLLKTKFEYADPPEIVQCTASADHVDLIIVCEPFLFLVSSDIMKTSIEYFKTCLSDDWMKTSLTDS